MHFGIGGKGTGGSFVCADEQNFYVHTRVRGVRACELRRGDQLKRVLNEPVLTDGGVITFDGSVLRAKTKSMDFSVEVDGSGDVIQAGSRIYAAGKDKITALTRDGEIVWSKPIDGQVLRLLAGGGKLVAVTLDGRILVYGDQPTSNKPISNKPIEESFERQPSPAEERAAAAQLIDRAAASDGYAIWYGVDDISFLSAILAESNLRVVVVESDEARVKTLRQALDATGQYGSRITVHQGDPHSYKAPPYIANLIVVGSSIGSATHKGATQKKLPIFPAPSPYPLPRGEGTDEKLFLRRPKPFWKGWTVKNWRKPRPSPTQRESWLFVRARWTVPLTGPTSTETSRIRSSQMTAASNCLWECCGLAVVPTWTCYPDTDMGRRNKS